MVGFIVGMLWVYIPAVNLCIDCLPSLAAVTLVSSKMVLRGQDAWRKHPIFKWGFTVRFRATVGFFICFFYCAVIYVTFVRFVRMYFLDFAKQLYSLLVMLGLSGLTSHTRPALQQKT